MYADVVTKSMKAAIEETEERRKIQEEYNQKNHIVPKGIDKTVAPEILEEEKNLSEIDHDFMKLTKKEKQSVIKDMKNRMLLAATNLEFERAAELRDQIVLLESKIK